MAAHNALFVVWRSSSPFRSIILFLQLETRAGKQPPQFFSQAKNAYTARNRQLGVGFPIPTPQLPDDYCWKLEPTFRKLEFGNRVPEGGSWKSNSNFWKLESSNSRRRISNFQLPSPGGRNLDSNFWKLDLCLWVARLDQPPQYFFRAKTCQKTWKTTVY